LILIVLTTNKRPRIPVATFTPQRTLNSNKAQQVAQAITSLSNLTDKSKSLNDEKLAGYTSIDDAGSFTGDNAQFVSGYEYTELLSKIQPFLNALDEAIEKFSTNLENKIEHHMLLGLLNALGRVLRFHALGNLSHGDQERLEREKKYLECADAFDNTLKYLLSLIHI
jgi:glutamate-1-semialdehyde aminotransferase